MKKKPCEFCQSEQFWQQPIGSGMMQVEWYPENHLISVYACYTDDYGLHEDSMATDVDYCPKCGRKLDY